MHVSLTRCQKCHYHSLFLNCLEHFTVCYPDLLLLISQQDRYWVQVAELHFVKRFSDWNAWQMRAECFGKLSQLSMAMLPVLNTCMSALFISGELVSGQPPSSLPSSPWLPLVLAQTFFPGAQKQGEAGRGVQASTPSLLPRDGGSPTAAWGWGGEGLLVTWQGKRASWGAQDIPQESTLGDGTDRRKNQVLGCVCTKKFKPTMLSAIWAVQNQTATGFLLLIHCDTLVITVHPPRDGSFRACFSKLKTLAARAALPNTAQMLSWHRDDQLGGSN